MKQNVSIFLTFNPATALPSYSLPGDIRANFRQVALVKPDLSLIMKAKCSQLNLKAAGVLSLRLKLLAELTKDQL